MNTGMKTVNRTTIQEGYINSVPPSFHICMNIDGCVTHRQLNLPHSIFKTSQLDIIKKYCILLSIILMLTGYSEYIPTSLDEVAMLYLKREKN